MKPWKQVKPDPADQTVDTHFWKVGFLGFCDPSRTGSTDTQLSLIDFFLFYRSGIDSFTFGERERESHEWAKRSSSDQPVNNTLQPLS